MNGRHIPMLALRHVLSGMHLAAELVYDVRHWPVRGLFVACWWPAGLPAACPGLCLLARPNPAGGVPLACQGLRPFGLSMLYHQWPGRPFICLHACLLMLWPLGIRLNCRADFTFLN